MDMDREAIMIMSKPGGYTVNQLIEALKQIPDQHRNVLVEINYDGLCGKVGKIDVWNKGVELVWR